MFTVQQENETKFGTKNEILLFSLISISDFLWLYYYGFMHNSIKFEF